MNAILPLNVTAIRVNNNDAQLIVSGFKGRTALFENLPYKSDSTVASTGDTINQGLEDTSTPANPLKAGVHVHWELPDYYRRGSQNGASGQVVFPHAPNRWLVVRYLSQWDTGSSQWQPAIAKAFLIESDYVNASRWDINRPGVSVPLPINPDADQQPYMWMGRVLEYQSWNPYAEKAQDFLPYYVNATNEPYYLTSIGFVGPSFASYYPECNSVFGFWDNFSDLPAIHNAIANNTPIQFRASYQVTGWINEQDHDPLRGIGATVTSQYNAYVAQQNQLKLDVTETPADVFAAVVQQFAPSWRFNKADIPYTLNADKTIKSLVVPEGTLSSGMVEEVVWNMLEKPGSTYFLNNPDAPSGPSGTWTDTVKVSIGNSTAEALSALLKYDLGGYGADPNQLTDIEIVLNALQAGLLRKLEDADNKIILLDENLHSQGFAALAAGLLWQVRTKHAKKGDEVTLPLDLAERLALVNEAQKAFDQAWAGIDSMTRQIFMDWIRYVKLYVAGIDEPYLTWASIQNFLVASGGSELDAVVNAVQGAGALKYQRDDTGRVIGIDPPPPGNTLANTLYSRLHDLMIALAELPQYEVVSTTAPEFNIPAEPVVMVEGERIEPVRRNGSTDTVFVRLSSELITTLTIASSGQSFSVPASSLEGVPVVTDVTPMRDDVQALLAEAYLLILSVGTFPADALKKQGGNDNPAVKDYARFLASLQTAQGGYSPLENATTTGLFAAIHAEGYKPEANPSLSVTQPLALSVSFTNSAATAWAPDPVGWSAQSHPAGFPDNRVDPFLPMFILWQIRFRPLKWGSITPGQQNYTPDNLTRYFELDSDAVDYLYEMNDGQPADFTITTPSSYTSSVVLSRRPVYSLTSQIDLYIGDYPNDKVDPELIKARDAYKGRRIMSQALSGLNVKQILRDYIPQITVEDIPLSGQDPVTPQIQQAAITNVNWYTWAFNNVLPIARNQPGNVNFGPLRSGFMQIMQLGIVDVFGQVMVLSTEQLNPDTSLQTIVSYNMQPRQGDTVNADWIYLAPRLLSPARVWFRWLSAAYDSRVPGITGDFVEMNAHPASSPICGWILPNHLDSSLFFYTPEGEPIGSFGIEADALKYRTRAGNRNNVQDLLDVDIGPPGDPTVNPHLADYMWWINDTGKKDPQFFLDLMCAILRSDTFINPANFAQNPSLSVLIGRPLAITRAVLSLETPGSLLPLSQADILKESPFPQDVLNNRYQYLDRQQTSSANLGSVKLPARVGDLVNMDDGLVGYLIDKPGPSPYGTFYSPAASKDGQHGVVQPQFNTIELTLNEQPISLTMLVDPRAGVHLTTGVLPVEEIFIPADQYGDTVSGLAMTFFNNPVLRGANSFIVPVPKEEGYDWSWIDPSTNEPIPLEPNQATEFAVYGYTPQTVQEGWLELTHPLTTIKGEGL